jgi:membrane protein implicated in regulation of membrane protease activity
MLEEFFSSSALNIVYGVILLISFIFAVLSLLGSDVGDAVDLDFEGDFDAADSAGFLNLSTFSLAMFGGAFGLTGLITHISLGMSAGASIFLASLFGLLVGILAQVIFFYILSPTKSSHYSLSDDAVGREAQVIVSIPSEGLGTVAFDNVSGRVTLGARSLTGKQIHTGDAVDIVQVTGRIALVRPIEDKVLGDGKSFK